MTKPVLRKGESGEDLLTVVRNRNNSAESDPGTLDFTTYMVTNIGLDECEFRRFFSGNTVASKTVVVTSDLYKYLEDQYKLAVTLQQS